MVIQNGLGRGHFFQNQECVNILGCSITFYEYKNVFFDACRQRLHNSGLICDQATAVNTVILKQLAYIAALG